MAYQRINETGIAELREWLASVAKSPAHYDTERALHAWAAEAEESLAAGNGPSVELRERHTLSGVPETFAIGPSGVDTFIDEEI
jgi:hypothetical protein